MNWVPISEVADPLDRARRLFLPSSPIREASRLYGRARQLEQVKRELRSPGRSVFVFGDRGVGKTSLAQTAAYMINRTEEDPVFVSCYNASFSQVVTKVARDLMRLPYYRRQKQKKVAEMKLGGAVGHILYRIETQPSETVTVEPLYAIDMIAEVAPPHETAVVVVDEMDQANMGLKKDIAHFVKELGDRDCPVKFIFTGIASDVNDLLDEHESAFRGIASVRLDRLLVGDLMEITREGFSALDIGVPETVHKRVAMLSDGFAYFTHLLGLKMAERALDDEHAQVAIPGLEAAVADAVESSEVYLKKPYEKAVRKYQNQELILWALADHYLLERQYKDLYQSYLEMCRRKFHQEGWQFIAPVEPLDSEPDALDELDDADPDEPEESQTGAIAVFTKQQFSNALQRLKNKSHGAVLESPRQQRGWYRFTIPMMRGYCRLAAARQGVHIGLRYLDSHNRLVTEPAPGS